MYVEGWLSTSLGCLAWAYGQGSSEKSGPFLDPPLPASAQNKKGRASRPGSGQSPLRASDCPQGLVGDFEGPPHRNHVSSLQP